MRDCILSQSSLFTWYVLQGLLSVIISYEVINRLSPVLWHAAFSYVLTVSFDCSNTDRIWSGGMFPLCPWWSVFKTLLLLLPSQTVVHTQGCRLIINMRTLAVLPPQHPSYNPDLTTDIVIEYIESCRLSPSSDVFSQS